MYSVHTFKQIHLEIYWVSTWFLPAILWFRYATYTLNSDKFVKCLGMSEKLKRSAFFFLLGQPAHIRPHDCKTQKATVFERTLTRFWRSLASKNSSAATTLLYVKCLGMCSTYVDWFINQFNLVIWLIFYEEGLSSLPYITI